MTSGTELRNPSQRCSRDVNLGLLHARQALYLLCYCSNPKPRDHDSTFFYHHQTTFLHPLQVKCLQPWPLRFSYCPSHLTLGPLSRTSAIANSPRTSSLLNPMYSSQFNLALLCDFLFFFFSMGPHPAEFRVTRQYGVLGIESEPVMYKACLPAMLYHCGHSARFRTFFSFLLYFRALHPPKSLLGSLDSLLAACSLSDLQLLELAPPVLVVGHPVFGLHLALITSSPKCH